VKSFSEALSANVALRLGAGRLDRMQVVSSSYGNDSLAVVQWCAEQGFENVHVVFIDTGWSAEGWLDRVAEAEQWVRSLGFTAHRIDPVVKFEELIESRHGFPNQRYQWCSAHLKGIPFLEWIDTVDPDFTSTVMIGKRREESREREQPRRNGRSVASITGVGLSVVRSTFTPKMIATGSCGERRFNHYRIGHKNVHHASMPIARTCCCLVRLRSHESSVLSSRLSTTCSDRNATWGPLVFDKSCGGRSRQRGNLSPNRHRRAHLAIVDSDQ